MSISFWKEHLANKLVQQDLVQRANKLVLTVVLTQRANTPVLARRANTLVLAPQTEKQDLAQQVSKLVCQGLASQVNNLQQNNLFIYYQHSQFHDH